LLDFGDWVKTTLRAKYFDTLTLLLNRGELGLASLSIQKGTSMSTKEYNLKVDIGCMYQLFIHKVLEKCVKSLI
jgi:hypothetical protein